MSKNLSHIKNILWSCWYVIEDLWRLIASSILLISRIIWKFLRPVLLQLSKWAIKQFHAHKAGSSSAIAHLLLIIIVAGGLPSCTKKDKKQLPPVIMVDLITLPTQDNNNFKTHKNNPEHKAVIKIEPKKPAKIKRVQYHDTKKPKEVKKPKVTPKITPKKPKPIKIIQPKIIHKPKFIEKPKEVKKPKVTPKITPKKPKIKPPLKPKATPKIEDKPTQKPQTKKITATQNPPTSVSQESTKASQAEIAKILLLVQSQLEQCWNSLPGTRNADKNIVTVNFQLSKWGTVLGKVKVVDPQSGEAFKIAKDNAVRAVLKCSPLKGLPIKKHDLWKEIELTFDPSNMGL